MDKFVKNCFNFELDLKNAGRTNINTAIKDIAGTTSSNPIFLIFPKIFSFLKEFFYTRI